MPISLTHINIYNDISPLMTLSQKNADPEPQVGIVIVNYNGFEDTRKCLSKIEGIKYENYCTIVVENGSTDDSAKRLDQLEGGFSLIANEDNLGYAAGANVGINYLLQANVEYVLLLNNDTEPEEEFLQELVEAIQYREEIVATSGVIRYRESGDIQYAGGKLSPYTADVNYSQSIEDDEVYPTEAVLGALVLLDANFLREIGGLDKNYFFGRDDIDLSYTIKEHGKYIYINPKCIVYHEGGAVAGTWNPFRIYHMTINRLYFLWKKLPLHQQLIALLYFIVSRIALATPITDVVDDKRAFIKYTFQGIYDYLTQKDIKPPEYFRS